MKLGGSFMRNERGAVLILIIPFLLVTLLAMQPQGVMGNAHKAKIDSAIGTARDTLTVALAAIQTDYYIGEYGSDVEVIDCVTSEEIEKAVGVEYKFTVKKNDDNELEITMEDIKYGYEFRAIVTKDLGISEFEMIK